MSFLNRAMAFTTEPCHFEFLGVVGMMAVQSLGFAALLARARFLNGSRPDVVIQQCLSPMFLGTWLVRPVIDDLSSDASITIPPVVSHRDPIVTGFAAPVGQGVKLGFGTIASTVSAMSHQTSKTNH
jgi:hypothetical protein